VLASEYIKIIMQTVDCFRTVDTLSVCLHRNFAFCGTSYLNCH